MPTRKSPLRIWSRRIKAEASSDSISRRTRLDRELGERGFDVVGIAVYSGKPEDVAQFLEDKEATYTVVVGDEDLTERFEVIGFPTYFLIDVDGSIYKMYVGEMKNMKEELEQDIEILLSRTDSKR